MLDAIGCACFGEITFLKSHKAIVYTYWQDSKTTDQNQEEEELEVILSMETKSKFEYDVFLNFRGPDVRWDFASFLCTMLMGAGVDVFLDDKEFQKGEEIDRELLKVIDKTRIYIPILSKGYATSSWCLREVAHIVECTSKSKGKKVILPIFYHMDPIDVKLKTQLYKRAIFEHKMKFASEELKWWENSLVEVAHKKGWHLNVKNDKSPEEVVELTIERFQDI